MREQTRHYTTSLPCIGLTFLKQLRLRLENGSPGVRIRTDTDSGRLYVTRQAEDYTLTIGDRTQSLKLVCTQAGFGIRHWYACPLCARRCGKLYIGRQAVVCRQCWDLHYASQSEDAENRMRRAIRRKRLVLWGDSEPSRELMNLAMPPGVFFKPKGMHWRTFEARQEA